MLFWMFLALNLLFLLLQHLPVCQIFTNHALLSNCLLVKLLKLLSFTKLVSVACALSSPNPYSGPHCNLTADAADVHIIFGFLWVDCWSKQEMTFHELKQHNFAKCLFFQMWGLNTILVKPLKAAFVSLLQSNLKTGKLHSG